MPSAALVLRETVTGSGMKAVTAPVRAFPIRIPRRHAVRVVSIEPDSESATYITSLRSIAIPLAREN